MSSYTLSRTDSRATTDRQNKTDSSDSHLRLLLTTLRKHKLLILSCALAITALAALIVLSIQPMYRASSSLLFEFEDRSKVVQIEELVALSGEGTEYLYTQLEILRSRQLAIDVFNKLDLAEHWDINQSILPPASYRASSTVTRILRRSAQFIRNLYFDTKNWISSLGSSRPVDTDIVSDSRENENKSKDEIKNDLMINKVMNRTRIIPAKGTTIINIYFEAHDPQLAAEVARAYGTLYIENHIDRKNALNEQASTWLNERIESSRERLNDSESRLIEFKEENGLVDVGGRVGGLNEQQIGIVTEELLDVKRDLQRARQLFLETNAARKKSDADLLAVPFINSDALIQEYRENVEAAQIELNKLQNRYLDRHPKVIEANTNLLTAQQNLTRQATNLADLIEKRYRVAQINLKSLEEDLKAEKSEIQDLGRKQIELVKLEREVEFNRELYERFFNRARESAEASGLTQTHASIANTVNIPKIPVKPKKGLILFSTLLISLIAMSVIVFAMEDFKDTIKGIHDVERKLKLEVLGIVPKVKTQGIFTNSKLSLAPDNISDPEGQLMESVRTIRTSLLLAEEASPFTKTILITSSVPEEGKSTVALNLAHSLSKVEKVLLIEADMRRPGIAHTLRSTQTGLADVLSGKSNPSHVLQSACFGSVDVITAGKIDEDSPELLVGDNFKNLLAVLKNHYDRILIDSAPVQAVGDALLLGQITDATIFVVRADSTASTIAKRAVQRLKHHRVNILGSIISQVDLQQVAKYGGDYYYQGFSDSYGYGGHARSASIAANPPQTFSEHSSESRSQFTEPA